MNSPQTTLDNSLLTLSTSDRTAVQEAILQDLRTQNWKALEAAIFISGNTYLYKRLTNDNPPRFTYKCLSPEALQRAFYLDKIDSGWLPQGIIRCGSNTQGDWAVIFIPPTKTAIDLIQTEIQSTLTVTLPGLVFVGIRQEYWLWAIADKAFNSEAIAYHAPLPNVYDSGQICWGTYTPPIASTVGLVRAWNQFISTPFANHLVQGRSRRHSTDICQQLQSLHRFPNQKSKPYPVKDLVPVRPGYREATIDKLIQIVLKDEP